MVRRGWVRSSINIHVRRLRHVFTWAASHEMLPTSVHAALVTMEPLKRGRSSASGSSRVRPVPQSFIDALAEHVARPVWTMIQRQLLTGVRPGELMKLRPADIDRSPSVWTYVPEEHNTMHHGHQRVICFGPKTQSFLAPLIAARAPDAFLFDPCEAVAETRAKPASTGKRRRLGQSPNPRRTQPRIQHHYTTSSYRRAIANGCDKATRYGPVPVPRWHPHQLRHNFGTKVRSEFGAEQAQIALGHQCMAVTQIYAERDLRQLHRVALAIA